MDAVCRVCRSHEPVLLTPCKCSGSMKYVHQECLEEWLKHSRKKHCEICNYKFKFTPIYAENVPEHLNFSFLFKVLMKKISSSAIYSTRIFIAMVGWLMVVPFLVSFAWRVYFSPGTMFPSFSSLQDIEISNQTSDSNASGSHSFPFLIIPIKNPIVRYVFQELVFGQIICVLFIFCGFILLILKEYIVANTPREQQRQRQEAPFRNQQNQLRDNFEQNFPMRPNLNFRDEEINNRNPFRPPSDQPQHIPRNATPRPFDHSTNTQNHYLQINESGENYNYRDRNHEGHTSSSSDRSSHMDEFIDDLSDSSFTSTGFHGNQQQPENDDRIDNLNLPHENQPELADVPEEWMDRVREAEQAYEVFRRDNHHLFNEPVNDAPQRNNAAVDININFQINNRVAVAQVHAEGDFATLIGIKGPIRELIQNVFLMSLLIAAFIGALIWLPFTTGKYLTYFFLNYVVIYTFSMVVSTLESTLIYLSPITGPSLQLTMSWIIKKAQIKNIVLRPSFETNFLMFVFGFGIISLVAINRLQKMRIWKNPYMKTLRNTVKSVFVTSWKFQKLSCFLFVELLLFPTFCGVLVDFSTLSLMKGSDLEYRYQFHQANPWTSAFVHWATGTCLMIQFAQLVSGIRGVVRPGVLWFIRDPSDPHFNPMKEIMEKPVLQQLEKLFKGTIMYSSVIFSVFYGVRLVEFVVAIISSFISRPLFIPFGSRSSEYFRIFPVCLFECNATLFRTPVDLLIYLIFTPLIIRYINPEKYAMDFLKVSFRYASSVLSLSHFMFGEDKDLDQSAASNLYLQVPNHDHIDYKPGDIVLKPIGRNDPLVGKPDETEEDIKANWRKVSIPTRFRWRLVFLAILVWLSIITFLYLVISIPVFTGRQGFKWIRSAVGSNESVNINDIYSAYLGVVILICFLNVLKTVTSFVKVNYKNLYTDRESLSSVTNESDENEVSSASPTEPSVSQLAATLWQKTLKTSIGICIFGIVIPFAFGSLFECYLRYPYLTLILEDKVYSIDLLWTWSWGALITSVMAGLISIARENPLQQVLNEIRDGGIGLINVSLLMKSYVLPFIRITGAFICLPLAGGYSIKYVISLIGYRNINIYPYAFPITLISGLVTTSVYLIKQGIGLWIDHIRDEQFMVGRRLNNIQ